MTPLQCIDHLVFRVANLGETEQFYTALLGQEPERAEDSLMYFVGSTRLFFSLADQPVGQAFNKESVGLNHMAFGVGTFAELQACEQKLNLCKIAHSEIGLDRYGQREFIWLDDPDGMRIEFYLRPQEE